MLGGSASSSRRTKHSLQSVTNTTDHLAEISGMEESLVRVVTGAITVYRLRLTDLHLRELVVLLWIKEGEQFLRCLDGNLHFFVLGACALHKGVPPQGTLARCKRLFLQLEGLFRLMGNAKLTSDDDVLVVVQNLLETMNNSATHLLMSVRMRLADICPAGLAPAGVMLGKMQSQANKSRLLSRLQLVDVKGWRTH